ncbi:glycerol kinase-like [Homalodisca vitripennis]|uniref:glycerol kinase-like n=2 Tax=Homalodisca vitripennis TaxID=197043 RepID=UPI001EE9DC01|nr:glycerol kinase-like [Homalodisca vitripennis]XP_046677030.1 glycerol kinase-like [Homalodisca vitripennis]XP_046677031.1 glycerol kinase-like [Homalodisca vitripennis]
MSTRGRFGPLVGAIDEGTSSARFLVFAANTGEVLTYHQEQVTQICPKEGWVEQDPFEILTKVKNCVETSIDHLKKLDIDPGDIVSIGLTNQRETTIVWDPLTGKPLYNAIVWLDVRNADTVDQMRSKIYGKKAETLKTISGLPISTYFSALKLRWLLDNVPEVKTAVEQKRCFFGTVDTWLIWNLTGGVHGGLHITDVTNASRTMLMSLQTLQWDPMLCRFFDIPMSVLPQIRSSSEIYGYLAETSLRGVPISGCLGDQQAALVGQMCWKQGQAKNTYGTGCFLLYNTGTAIVQSTHGLLTTVAYKLGKNSPAIYALEGSVAVAGAAISWLRDNLHILSDVNITAELAQAASSTGQVMFVPAFSGLYAPYWRNDARGLIFGISEETKKEHLVKAALEAVCFQTRDILEAMNQDCGIPLTKLLVDGGMTVNSYAMQLQADLCGIPVVHPWMFEATALGAAMAAGSAEGIDVWDLKNMQPVPSDTYLPAISDDERDLRYAKWKMAIHRSIGWDLEASPNSSQNNNSSNGTDNILKLMPCGVFLMSSISLILLSQHFTC